MLSWWDDKCLYALIQIMLDRAKGKRNKEIPLAYLE